MCIAGVCHPIGLAELPMLGSVADVTSVQERVGPKVGLERGRPRDVVWCF